MFDEITSYLELLKKQRRLMTQQQISAIQRSKQDFIAIASEKMQIRDRLEERYREVFPNFKISPSNLLELLLIAIQIRTRLKTLIDLQHTTPPISRYNGSIKPSTTTILISPQPPLTLPPHPPAQRRVLQRHHHPQYPAK